ncbi:hypothetical protein BOTBODRAFT_192367 [Botryobasidium botryosum FD-172 SS1]|uniref:Timeless N-terminal domain-containing protein n=1 Tax=Botryobasidium botryosum (strain FD-172 SS1) TaxID=930990 RepID=A0A067LWI0_BOTB1|nr:hypothetical protein BOTBODRAFT_192367 [Botryobasidium botryosum FD-172 SS1]
MDDAIEISSSSSRAPSPVVDRRAILAPAIQNVVSALGGFDAGTNTYVLGDSCLGCLRDLKKLWRKDDTDDERTVARLFWDARVLPNDLVPILLETAGKGHVEDRCAIACADLMTAMTWPIDLAEELKELDDEEDAHTDYTALLQAQLSYKAAMLRPGVLKALFDIMIPPLAKEKKERTERDGQVINVILHAFRNLAFIKDPPTHAGSSSDRAELSSLQSKLITTLEEAHILDLFLTIASNAEEPSFNPWNALVLEIFYLLFRGVKPDALALDQKKQPRENLLKLLVSEEKSKRDSLRNASSRHSRFGTTISVRSGKDSYILHRQQALTADASTIMDLTKKRVTKKAKKQDELGTFSDLNVAALTVLQTVAMNFIENCFNPFLASVLKDIKAERPKITEKDNVRLLFLTKWFLAFFSAVREKEASGGQLTAQCRWRFEYVAEVVERGWVVWMLKRISGAKDEKPKQWVELQAGIDCLTQLLLLIDAMSHPNSPEAAIETAQTLQHQLYYSGEILDLAFDCLRSYKEQSIAYLDSTVHLGYVLLRMLEKWAKSTEMYVRKKKNVKKKGKAVTAEGEEEDVASEEENVVYRESMFTFESFEAKFAHEDITHTCLIYLSRYREFDSSDQMKRVVGLLHRQAVKAKAEGLFFKVSTLELFNQILKEQKSLPKETPYRDLIQLINFLLRKFFKAVAETPFLIVEAFFPKNRGKWKSFSSFQPETKESKQKQKGAESNSKFPPDVIVKKGYTWSQQLGIAIGCLVEDGKTELIDWVKNILKFVAGMRQSIVDEVDGDQELSQPEDEETIKAPPGPSREAIEKFKDYMIPYVRDEEADAATNNPHFKLMLRLLNFVVLEDDADELEWLIPAKIPPSDLQSSLRVIEQFLETPIDLEGKRASEMLRKKPVRRRRQRAATPSSSSSDADEAAGEISSGGADEDPETRAAKRKSKKKKRSSQNTEKQGEAKTRKKKEKQIYKSAQFIEDSDAEIGDDDVFFEKERALRREAELAAAGSGPSATMMGKGTKKRKKRASSPIASVRGGRKRQRGRKDDDGSESDSMADTPSGHPERAPSSVDGDAIEVISTPKPRPRPRPRHAVRRVKQGDDTAGTSSPTGAASSSPGEKFQELHLDDTSDLDADQEDEGGVASSGRAFGKAKKKTRVVILDDEDDE